MVMLNRIQAFFEQLSKPVENQHIVNQEQLSIACAVLLCEVMKADHVIEQDEELKLTQLLQTQFSLTEPEVRLLIKQALDNAEQSTDLYSYTSIINKTYDHEEKIKLVASLWQLANADGEISAIEHHLIRKIADLLHLRHSEYIASKSSLR